MKKHLVLSIALAAVLKCCAPPMVAAAEDAQTEAANPRQGVSAKEIQIGACVPFSGLLKMRGPAMVHGATAYFNYVNENGGVNGRTIQMSSCDDGFSPEKAIECFNGCLKDKVFLGGFVIGSASAVKYIRMAELTKMPLVGFDVGPPTVCELHANVFNLRPGYQDEVVRQVDVLWKHKLKKVALVYQNDAFGACVRDALLSELAKRNTAPVAESSCSRTLTDADAAYDHVKAASPDVIIMAVNTAPIKQLIKRRNEDHLKTLCTTLSSMEDALLESGKDADGMVISTVLPPMNSSEKSIELYKKLLKKYFPDDHPHAHGLECFLNAMVMVEGLKRAGADLTRDKFVKAMDTIHGFDLGAGPLFKVNFSNKNHVGWSNKVIALKVVRDGKQVDMTESDWK